jgi:spermidine synthase
MSQTTSEISVQGYYEEEAPVQRSSTRYAVTKCIVSQMTDSAHTVIIDNPDYGRMLFLDRELQSATYDERIYHETLVHPALNAIVLSNSGNNRLKVLVIGGAEGATVREVLRWSNKIAQIDWVDIDAQLVGICREHLQYADVSLYTNKAVTFYAEDIMVFLDRVLHPVYDCIIIDLPDPDPEGDGPLYGSMFWSLIKRALNPKGMVTTHVGPVEPGLGRQPGLNMVVAGAAAVDLKGAAYHTLIPSFQSEWGFWMSGYCDSCNGLPHSCAIMNANYQRTIFHWDKHWNLSI